MPFSTFNKAYIIENNIGTCDGDGSVGEVGRFRIPNGNNVLFNSYEKP